MKMTFHLLLSSVLAICMATQAAAAGAKKAPERDYAPMLMISEAPETVKTQWKNEQAFVRAWATGDARSLLAMMTRNIENLRIDMAGAPSDYRQDISREEAVSELLKARDIWSEYKITHHLTTISADSQVLPKSNTFFAMGKNEEGQTIYAELYLAFNAGKIQEIGVTVGPTHGYKPNRRHLLGMYIIKGTHLSSKDAAQPAASTLEEPEEPAGPRIAVERELRPAVGSTGASPENTGVAVDPEGIGTWGGVDRDYGSCERVLAAAGRADASLATAATVAAAYAALRQRGGRGVCNALIADEIFLLDQDKSVPGEKFKELLGMGYLIWPHDTWPIRAAVAGGVLEMITKIDAPGYEDPIYLKTTLIMDGTTIKAIGETECRNADKKVSGQRLPDEDYAALVPVAR